MQYSAQPSSSELSSQSPYPSHLSSIGMQLLGPDWQGKVAFASSQSSSIDTYVVDAVVVSVVAVVV